MTRETLPMARQNVTIETDWTDGASEVRMTLCVGFYPDGRIGEVFCDTGKTTAMQAMLDDICVIVSRCLQRGDTLADLSKSLGTLPVWRPVDGQMQQVEAPSSPVGAILAGIAEAAAWRAGGCEVAA